MPSMPASPVTPSRRRRSRPSTLDISNTSPSPYTSNDTTFSRRSSRTSFSSLPKQSPVTPRHPIFRRTTSGSTSVSIGADDRGMNEMGSLADELGDVWGEDAVDDQSSGFLEGLREGSAEPSLMGQGREQTFNTGDMLIHSPQPSSPVQRHSRKASRSNALSPQSNGHTNTRLRHRKTESNYDGSDYGPDSDPEDLPPTLLRRISDIESLTRVSMHPDDHLGEHGGIIARTTAGLKDLGPQASIENGTTRLITAYTSMTTHRTHKTKDLLAQSHSLLFTPQLYGSAIPSPAQLLGEDVLDDLLHNVQALMDCVAPATAPDEPSSPLSSLQVLVSNTAEFVYALRSLADALQESKVAAAAAGRRLKSARELVAELRLEEELREEGTRWIEKGDWERRLRDRECGRVCGDVVRGFERTCEVWRERLLLAADAGQGVQTAEVQVGA